MESPYKQRIATAPAKRRSVVHDATSAPSTDVGSTRPSQIVAAVPAHVVATRVMSAARCKKENYNMNVRSPRSEPPKVYNSLDDEQCGSFLKSKTFRKHWASMKERIKPFSAVNQLVEDHSSPCYIVPELPWVARDPERIYSEELGSSSRNDVLLDTHRALPQERTPYLSPSAPFESYDALFVAPPKDKTKSGRVAYPRKKVMHPLASLPDPKGPGKKFTPAAFSVLTETYISVLFKSEDFARRDLQKKEAAKRKHVIRHFYVVLSFYRERLDRVLDFLPQETRGRDDVVCAEQEARTKYQNSARVDRKLAKAQEEVFPDCPVMNVGDVRDVSANGSFMLDFRWMTTDQVELELAVLAFDKDSNFMGTITQSEIFRCPIGGNPVVRPWGGYRFRGAKRTSAHHISVEMLLHNLSFESNYDRFIIVMTDARRSGNLKSVYRSYLTLWTPVGEKPAEKLLADTFMEESLSMRLSDWMTCGCVVLASFIRTVDMVQGNAPDLSRKKSVRRGASFRKPSSVSLATLRSDQADDSTYSLIPKISWRVHVHGKEWDRVISYQRLAPLIQNTILMTPQQLNSEMWRSVVKLLLSEAESYEGLSRRETCSLETTHRRVIFNVCVEEYKAALHRQTEREDEEERLKHPPWKAGSREKLFFYKPGTLNATSAQSDNSVRYRMGEGRNAGGK